MGTKYNLGRLLIAEKIVQRIPTEVDPGAHSQRVGVSDTVCVVITHFKCFPVCSTFSEELPTRTQP